MLGSAAMQLLERLSILCGAAMQFALLAAAAPAWAQDKPKGSAVLPPVTITAAPNNAVEKPYRKMIRGMDTFERLRAAMAPNAALRFKLLKRKRETDIDHIVLEIVGSTVAMPVDVAPDRTFTLPRDRKAYDEDAVVTPDRRKQSMTWRADIRTPGLPPNTRRLGDLRLECRVGLEADLVSNSNTLGGMIANLFTDPVNYCGRKDARYLFFSDRPLFSVALVAGARREVLPVNELYAAASDDPGLKYDLPYCDCEVLVDRTYFMPLGDRSWPDDTLVEFEYMDDEK